MINLTTMVILDLERYTGVNGLLGNLGSECPWQMQAAGVSLTTVRLCKKSKSQ